jgi:hypothetical protein
MAVKNPVIVNGREYLNKLLSKGKRAARKIKTKGYIQIL